MTVEMIRGLAAGAVDNDALVEWFADNSTAKS